MLAEPIIRSIKVQSTAMIMPRILWDWKRFGEEKR